MSLKIEDLNVALQKIFGHSHFRPGQQEAIEAVLQGKNGLVMMPTGFGKSLCYQLPSQILEGLTLVVSPLIALMKDQVDAAQKKGLQGVSFINSSLGSRERASRYKALAQGDYRLLYVTPERFRKKEFWEALGRQRVSCLAVDEAHCISQWGHDFRPDYTRLKEVYERLGRPPTMALTATATPEVQKDILYQIGLPQEETLKIQEGVRRDNLKVQSLFVVGLEEKLRHIVALRNQHRGPAIVYFSLISTLEKASYELKRLGIAHEIYHGQLSSQDRRQAQEAFLFGKDKMILATPAFGLGIDKPNIRMIIHAEIPGSIEAYFQEIGRAGRDQKEAFCYLLFDPDDISIQMDFIKWANPDGDFILQTFRLLEEHPDKVAAEGLDFIRGELNFYNRRDFRVETAVNLLERWDCIAKTSRGIVALAPPPPELLEAQNRYLKSKRAHEKLLSMVELAKQEKDHLETIYRYFGVS